MLRVPPVLLGRGSQPNQGTIGADAGLIKGAGVRSISGGGGGGGYFSRFHL